MTRLRLLEKALLSGIWTGFGLLLLTPFVITSQTIFPFVVGKAVYARTLIALLSGFWVLLALGRPAYRPPRSWLLLLLGVSLGVATLAACFGVSVQRSFWSTYERMQGVGDLAHWFVLAVVLVAVVRTVRGWCVLLNLHLGVSLMMALLALAQYYAVDLPFFDYQPTEGRRVGVDWAGRVFATFGNPTYLGTYMFVNVTLALGFLTRSFILAVRPALPASGGNRGAGRWQQWTSPRTEKPALPLLWSARCFWGGVALLDLWVLGLSGARGATLGLVIGLGFSGAVALFLTRTRRARLVVVGLMGVLGGVLMLIALLFFRPAALPFDTGFFQPFTPRPSTSLPDVALPNVHSRLATWEAGFKGFLDKPLLGWGPENYISLFGRHASGVGGRMTPPDSPHSKLIEELATKGLVGLLSYLTLWALTFFVVARAVTRMDARGRVLMLCVGAALMGYFVQSQFSFDTATSSLQYTLLLAFVANLERGGGKTAPACRPEARLQHIGMRLVIVVGVLALVGMSLRANQAIYSAASATRKMVASDSTFSQSIAFFKQAASDFTPLANYPRLLLFENMARLWPRLAIFSRAEILALMDTEAAAALRSEPENWRLYVALARLYRASADTIPTYEDAARRYHKKALELAPQRRETVALPPRSSQPN